MELFIFLFFAGFLRGLMNFYRDSNGNDPFFIPNFRLRYKKWLSSTLTNAFMKFLSYKLVILVSSFSQWLGCLSPALFIERSTFRSLSFEILSKLSPFCTSNFLISYNCSDNNMRNPVTAASWTPYFYNFWYLFKCKLVISLTTAELKG